MNKYYIFLILLSLLILLTKSIHHYDMKELEDEDDDEEDDEDGYGQFRQALREYLSDHKLNDSDKLIKPKRMKQIFLKTVGDLDSDAIPQQVKDLYDQLADYFVNQYYDKKKQIRGKDVYKLFNFNDISTKFNELIQANPYYGEDNQDDDDDLNDENFNNNNDEDL